jgi:ketosteroid isomerase-like protein
LKPIFSILALILAATGVAHADDKDAEVRTTIQTFYKNFNEGFTSPADYATEDWNHINPNGGRTQGREATLKRVREVHQTFLKGAKESIESMDVRFAADGVAVGTVISVSSPFVSPDGTKHDEQHSIRTFIIVKRGDLMVNYARSQHNGHRTSALETMNGAQSRPSHCQQ